MRFVLVANLLNPALKTVRVRVVLLPLLFEHAIALGPPRSPAEAGGYGYILFGAPLLETGLTQSLVGELLPARGAGA